MTTVSEGEAAVVVPGVVVALEAVAAVPEVVVALEAVAAVAAVPEVVVALEAVEAVAVPEVVVIVVAVGVVDLMMVAGASADFAGGGLRLICVLSEFRFALSGLSEYTAVLVVGSVCVCVSECLSLCATIVCCLNVVLPMAELCSLSGHNQRNLCRSHGLWM